MCYIAIRLGEYAELWIAVLTIFYSLNGWLPVTMKGITQSIG